MDLSQPQVDLDDLRRRVRNSQHVRSVPLIIIGVLLVNYGTVSFAPSPVAWRYGAPLAFVAVWAATKANEARTGIGAGRADYLVAAGFVFMLTNLVLLRPFSRVITDVARIEGLWIIVVGLALLGVAWASADAILSITAGAIGAAGALLFVEGATLGGPAELILGPGSIEQPWGDVIVAGLGAAMVLGGIIAYRGERQDR
jgi:hypothetical protein